MGRLWDVGPFGAKAKLFHPRDGLLFKRAVSTGHCTRVFRASETKIVLDRRTVRSSELLEGAIPDWSLTRAEVEDLYTQDEVLVDSRVI